MSVVQTITQMQKEYKIKLARDLLFINFIEKKEIKNIDLFCRLLDARSNTICLTSSSNEVPPPTLAFDESSNDIQVCYDSKALKVKKVVIEPLLDKLSQANNINIESSSPKSLECSNNLTNVDKVLREVPQQQENWSCISPNSSNFIDANKLEKKVQILQSAGKAVLIKLSYGLINALKEPEGLLSERCEQTEKIIDVITLKNEVAAVKFNNVFRKNCTLCAKRYADSFTTLKTKVLVDIIEIKNVSGTNEANSMQRSQMRTGQFAKEHLKFNIFPTRTTSDIAAGLFYDVDENSTIPVIKIFCLSIPLKYSSINSDSSIESHFTTNGLEHVKIPIVSCTRDTKDDDTIVKVSVFDNKLDENNDEIIIDSDSENSVEHFIKQEPRLLNSIVKLEDVGVHQWGKKSLKRFSEKKFNKCANIPHENIAPKLDASARFLRLVKRRAIQNLNRTTKTEERKYNTRSSNRENRVRFKVENGTLIIIGRKS